MNPEVIALVLLEIFIERFVMFLFITLISALIALVTSYTPPLDTAFGLSCVGASSIVISVLPPEPPAIHSPFTS